MHLLSPLFSLSLSHPLRQPPLPSPSCISLSLPHSLLGRSLSIVVRRTPSHRPPLAVRHLGLPLLLALSLPVSLSWCLSAESPHAGTRSRRILPHHPQPSTFLSATLISLVVFSSPGPLKPPFTATVGAAIRRCRRAAVVLLTELTSPSLNHHHHVNPSPLSLSPGILSPSRLRQLPLPSMQELHGPLEPSHRLTNASPSIFLSPTCASPLGRPSLSAELPVSTDKYTPISRLG